MPYFMFNDHKYANMYFNPIWFLCLETDFDELYIIIIRSVFIMRHSSLYNTSGIVLLEWQKSDSLIFFWHSNFLMLAQVQEFNRVSLFTTALMQY